MRVYFYGTPSSNLRLAESYKEIIRLLSRKGFEVLSKIKTEFVSELHPSQLEEIQASGEIALAHVDGLVLETTTRDSEIGYLLAFMILYKKPILCLYQHGTQIKEMVRRLGKNCPPFLLVSSYKPKDLEKILDDYVHLFERQGAFSDVPTIKFTLRISPKISRFLHWKTRQEKKTKADFLRDLLEKISSQDEQYQKQLTKGRNDRSEKTPSEIA